MNPRAKQKKRQEHLQKNEMSLFDLIDCLVDYGGYYKYLCWCLLQDNFWEEFMDDIEKCDDVYFAENFTERKEEE